MDITKIRPFVSRLDSEKLVQAFISGRLDYCKAFLPVFQKKYIEIWPLIQNSASRLWTKTRKQEHITPVLTALHWLPVSIRIDFKIILLVWEALNGLSQRGPIMCHGGPRVSRLSFQPISTPADFTNEHTFNQRGGN